MSYFQAYRAYQLGNYDRCLRVLEKLESNTRILDLKAQIHFMKREYQEAYDIYQQLIQEKDEYTDERKENILLIIVCAALEKPGLLKTKNNDLVPTTEEVLDQVESFHLCNEPLVPMRNEKKKRKRKGPLPKNMVPGATPDPERWIPKRDRKSNVTRQRKNKRKGPKSRSKYS